MCLYVTGRKWWDLVIYNPNFKQNIIIYRIESDEEKQEQLKVGLETGKQIIKDLINKYNNLN
jgi:hypothetical protein